MALTYERLNPQQQIAHINVMLGRLELQHFQASMHLEELQVTQLASPGSADTTNQQQLIERLEDLIEGLRAQVLQLEA